MVESTLKIGKRLGLLKNEVGMLCPSGIFILAWLALMFELMNWYHFTPVAVVALILYMLFKDPLFVRITTENLICTKGAYSKVSKIIPISSIKSIQITKNGLDKIINSGTLIIQTETETTLLSMYFSPDRTKNLIEVLQQNQNKLSERKEGSGVINE